MFLRKRQIGGETYYSLVESFRSAGKVRQRVIASLGKSSSIEEAISDAEGAIEFWTDIESRLTHRPLKQKILFQETETGRMSFFSIEQARKQIRKSRDKLALLRDVNKCHRMVTHFDTTGA